MSIDRSDNYQKYIDVLANSSWSTHQAKDVINSILIISLIGLNIYIFICLYAYVYILLCVRACVRACVYVYVCVYVLVCVF